ncbi:MAG: mitochondrial fission ELM1 family protein [Alphaproteobacteria bacterium]
MAATTCWVLSDGKPGHENPCRGLAEAVGLDTVVKRVAPRAPWSHLPPRLWFAPFRAPGPGSDALAPPWPDLMIAAGRQTVALSIAIRKASGGRTFTVQVLKPQAPLERFDLVAAPAHDCAEGANVIATIGALNRVTPRRLEAEAARFAATVARLPTPRVAVLVGGDGKRHRLTPAVAAGIGARLDAFARDAGAGLMVTPSRRTGAASAAALGERLDPARTVMWNGEGDNPYFGYLGLADAIVVTGDSIAMVSEACTTGKPVYVLDLPGGAAKFRRFHRDLRDTGRTRRFDGRLESWRYPKLDETARVAAEVRRRLGLD